MALAHKCTQLVEFITLFGFTQKMQGMNFLSVPPIHAPKPLER
jgi:hypothetical protein